MKWIRLVLVAAGAIAAVAALMAVTAKPAVDHAFFAEERPLGGVQVIAHRGGAALRPENTLPAFMHATQLGADVLEMDVRLTADAAVVVIHDATVDRTTDGSGAVSEMPLARLRELDAGYRWSADGGKTFPFRGTGVTIPLLEEVFETFTAKRMNIEIKSSDTRLPQLLCAHVRKHNMSTKVLVASFHAQSMENFRKHCPETATSMTATEARTFYIMHLARLSAAYSPVSPALQMPYRVGDQTITTADFILAAHRRNLKTHVWVINDEAQMRSLIAADIDGIITDRPDLLLQMLGRAKNPQPR